MRFLFYLGHPAHFHLFKNTIKSLKNKGHKVSVLIKKKDVLEDLLRDSNIEYINILPHGRKDTKLGIALGVIKRDWRLFWHCVFNRPNLLIGTSTEIGHVGTLLRIPSINVNEDDAAAVPLYAKISYPWCTTILTPSVCNNGKWEYKAIKYNSYHELAYLHPNNFRPSKVIVEKYFPSDEPYFLIRFAKLKAHHDEGINGLDLSIALKIIDLLKPHGRVYITSERTIEPELEDYRIAINPLDMHHVMAFAQLYIGDSQTMAAEAGVLGVPFVRFNDFVGRIGYLRDLEDNYRLGYGILPSYPSLLIDKVSELLAMHNRREVFLTRRNKMLEEKIDAQKFLSWFIQEYPNSVKTMRENFNFQSKFK
jgi:uncharacterized protein